MRSVCPFRGVRSRGAGAGRPRLAAAVILCCSSTMALEVIQIEVGLLENFCEILLCRETGKAVLVDPAFEVDRLLRRVAEEKCVVETIVLTHAHDDHIAGLDEAQAATNAVVRCHPADVECVEALAGRGEKPGIHHHQQREA